MENGNKFTVNYLNIRTLDNFAVNNLKLNLQCCIMEFFKRCRQKGTVVAMGIVKVGINL